MELNARNLVLAALLGLAGWAFFTDDGDKAPDASPVQPCPPDGPCPVPAPKPKPKPKPWGATEVASVEANELAKCNCTAECKCERVCACRLSGKKCSSACRCSASVQGVVGASVGGPVSPSGKPIQVDLPPERHKRNITSKGEGCCVQTSVGMNADWQNVPALVGMEQWVKEKGLPGGAWPGALDDRIPKCAKDRGYPVPEYLQVEGPAAEVVPVLKLALKTGRPAGVTYSKSPSGRYGGSAISHMVCAMHADEEHVAILDNNYVNTQSDATYEWLTWDEFTRIANKNGSIWIVVLLSPPAAPVPRN